MDYLVTYDIETTTQEGVRRLAKVAQVCESYGTRVQYSVFECRLTETKVQHLMGQLADVIEPRVDSIHLYRFEGLLSSARVSLGRPGRELGQPWII